MKKLFLISLIILELHCSTAIIFNDSLYLFNEKGDPKYRITSSGSIEGITNYGFVDIRFYQHIKDLKIFDDQKFKKLDNETKRKYFEKYFDKEIKPILIGVNQKELDRLLEIFILKFKN